VLLFFSGVASICMDFGHLTLKRGKKTTNTGEESSLSKEARVIIIKFSFFL